MLFGIYSPILVLRLTEEIVLDALMFQVEGLQSCNVVVAAGGSYISLIEDIILVFVPVSFGAGCRRVANNGVRIYVIAIGR